MYLHFNPYIVSIALFSILYHPKKLQWLITIIIFLPALVEYRYTLLVMFLMQALYLAFFKKKHTADKFFTMYYLTALTIPAFGEAIGTILQLVYGFLFHNYLNDLQLNLVCLIPELILCILLAYFLSKKKYELGEISIDFQSSPSFSKFIVQLVWTFTVTDYVILLIIGNSSIKGFFAILLLIVYFILFIILFYSLYIATRQNHKITQNRIDQAAFDQIKEYTKDLEQINKSLQQTRHDYRNILLSLSGILKDVDQQAGKNYISQLLNQDSNLFSKNTSNTPLTNLKVSEIKYLLLAKIHEAEQAGIKTTVEINKEINHFPGNIVSLVRICGILLDNAIEACNKQKDPQIIILLSKYETGAISLDIQNSISERIPLNKIFKIGQTTKDGHQGIGLTNLQELVDSEPAFSLEVTESNSLINFEILMEDETC